MKKLFLFVVSASLLLFAGCDELTEVTIPVIDKVTIPIGEIEIGDALRAASEGYTPFEMTQSISIDDLGLGSYKNTIKHVVGVAIQKASVRVYTDADGDYDVENFKIVTLGSSPLNFELESYVLDTWYTDNDLKVFAENFVKKALTETFTVKLTGETNLPEGEILKAEIVLEGLSIKIKVL